MKTVVPPRIPIEVRLAEASPVAFGAADEKGLRTFSGTAYTGATVLVGSRLRAVWDLQGIVGVQRQPALLNHDPDRIAGYTRSIAFGGGGSVEVAGVLSASTSAAQEVGALADEGFPWQMSVYLDAREFADDVEDLRENQSAQVNGRTVSGPDMLVFRRSRLREVTFCPLGKDDGTHVRVLSEKARTTMANDDDPTLTTERDAGPATVAQLRAAFPDDPSYVLDQVEASATLVAARSLYQRLAAARAEEREAREAAEAQVAELRERIALLEQRPTGVAPLRTPAPGERPPAAVAPAAYSSGARSRSRFTGAAYQAWRSRVAEVKLQDGVRESAAVLRAARQFPDMHVAMLEEVNGGAVPFDDHRQRFVIGGR